MFKIKLKLREGKEGIVLKFVKYFDEKTMCDKIYKDENDTLLYLAKATKRIYYYHKTVLGNPVKGIFYLNDTEETIKQL